MSLTSQSIPVLRIGCKLHNHPTYGDILLKPEGVIRLNETGMKILSLCDGHKAVSEIANHLHQTYENKSQKEIEEEVLDFLEGLNVKGVLDY